MKTVRGLDYKCWQQHQGCSGSQSRSLGWSPHSQDHHVTGCQEHKEGSLLSRDCNYKVTAYIWRGCLLRTTPKKEDLKQLVICILPLHVLSVLILIPEATRYNENNLGRVSLMPSNFQIGNALIFSQWLEISITNSIILKCLPLLWDTIGLTASKVTHLRDEAAHFYNLLARTLLWKHTLTLRSRTAPEGVREGSGAELGPEDPVPSFSKCSRPTASEDNIPKWFSRPQEKQFFFFFIVQWLLRQ